MSSSKGSGDLVTCFFFLFGKPESEEGGVAKVTYDQTTDNLIYF